MFSYTMKLNYH